MVVANYLGKGRLVKEGKFLSLFLIWRGQSAVIWFDINEWICHFMNQFGFAGKTSNWQSSEYSNK